MYPITLGANIGTTCTGLLAALVSAKVNALQIALCHLSFNIFGVLLLYPFEYTRKLPINAAKFYGRIAKRYAWFPFYHIITTFVLFPLALLGISLLFETNIVGIVFGSLLCTFILGCLCKLYYWYYYEDGGNWLMLKLEVDPN